MTTNSDSQRDYLLEKAKRYCAIQERAASDVRKKLYEWKAKPDKMDKIISILFKENFINEERYARVFVRGKFRIKKWGRIKIKAELRSRRITDNIIGKALEEIDEDEYLQTLEEIINKKRLTLSEPESYTGRGKLLNYAVSKGYEKHLIMDLL